MSGRVEMTIKISKFFIGHELAIRAGALSAAEQTLLSEKNILSSNVLLHTKGLGCAIAATTVAPSCAKA